MRDFILAMIGLGISITEVVGRDSGGSNLGPSNTSNSFILREDGSYLLREDGARFVRETF